MKEIGLCKKKHQLKVITTDLFFSGKTDHKLTLFHLVNDIVQHSKRKNYTELLEKFQLVLKESMPHLKEPKICEKVVRCLNIWIERSVFEEKFISDLLSIVGQKGAESKDAADILDTFQVCTTSIYLRE